MVVFVVPVKSAQISTNWKVFSVLVDRTMRSICQQTSSNFKVVVACHEIPEIDFSHPAIEFVQVDFSPPTDEAIRAVTNDDPKNYRNAAKEADKAKKIMTGIAHGRQYNPSHFMVVDADDCISRDLVDFVEKDGGKTAGWYFKKGYIYNEGSRIIFLNKNTFNVLCGTCIMIKSEYVDELLETEPRALFNHDFTVLSDGTELQPLPFPGAVYSIGNTENYCSTPEAVKRMNSYSFLRKDFFENIIRKMAKYRVKPLSTNLRAKYGLVRLDLSGVFEE